MFSHKYDSQIINDLEVDNDELDNIANLAADLLCRIESGDIQIINISVDHDDNEDSVSNLKNALTKMGYEIK